MNRALLALLAASLSSLPLSAQSTSQQRSPSVILHSTAASQSTDQPAQPTISTATPSGNCPVSLHAGHLADGNLVKTDSSHPRGIGQRLSLSLTSHDEKQVTGARLTVHGLTPKGHVAQAHSAGDGSSDSVQTFYVKFSAGPQLIAIANLWVPGMSAVERIDVESVTYLDGSTWKLADGQSCQINPDPFMLISSK